MKVRVHHASRRSATPDESEGCGKNFSVRSAKGDGSSGALKFWLPRPNLLPEFIFSQASLGRESNDVAAAIGTSERIHRLPHLIASEPVTLGGYDYMRTLFGCQKFQQLPVAFLRRNV